MLALLGAILLWWMGGAGLGSVSDGPCSICQDKGSLACNRCDGKGARTVSCSRCSGDRKLVCPVTRCVDGRYTCPACKGHREIFWAGGQKDPCRFCAQKGSLKCPVCKGNRTVECPDCEGKGKFSVACAACLGLKCFPCPLTRDAAPCAACKGAGSFACRDCRGIGTFEGRCKDCFGFELKLCQCVGGEAVCDHCYGSGRIRMVLERSGTAAGTSKCDTCASKGSVKCKGCTTNGVLPCKTKPPVEDCAPCKEGRIACPRCAR